MNNLSNKELCLLYLLTTDAIVRCKQSAGVDCPLGNVDVVVTHQWSGDLSIKKNK